jgi:hypothetical protein
MIRERSPAVIASIAAVVLFLLAGGAPRASADMVSYDIGIGNSAISGYPGPYATVTVNLTDSTHATITFTSLTNNGNIYLMGDGQSADVNVNATSWTIGSFMASNAGTGFTPGPLSDGGSNNVDGFGVFNQTTTSFDGFSHSSDMISFVLTDTSGMWASAANVLTPNADGYVAGIHVYVTSFPANAANGAIATGFAVNGSAPEASSVALTSLVLLAFGAALIRARRNALA